MHTHLLFFRWRSCQLQGARGDVSSRLQLTATFSGTQQQDPLYPVKAGLTPGLDHCTALLFTLKTKNCAYVQLYLAAVAKKEEFKKKKKGGGGQLIEDTRQK